MGDEGRSRAEGGAKDASINDGKRRRARTPSPRRRCVIVRVAFFRRRRPSQQAPQVKTSEGTSWLRVDPRALGDDVQRVLAQTRDGVAIY